MTLLNLIKKWLKDHGATNWVLRVGEAYQKYPQLVLFGEESLRYPPIIEILEDRVATMGFELLTSDPEFFTKLKKTMKCLETCEKAYNEMILTWSESRHKEIAEIIGQ